MPVSPLGAFQPAIHRLTAWLSTLVGFGYEPTKIESAVLRDRIKKYTAQ